MEETVNSRAADSNPLEELLAFGMHTQELRKHFDALASALGRNDTASVRQAMGALEEEIRFSEATAEGCAVVQRHRRRQVLHRRGLVLFTEDKAWLHLSPEQQDRLLAGAEKLLAEVLPRSAAAAA